MHFQDHELLGEIERRLAKELQYLEFVEKKRTKRNKRIYRGYIDQRGNKAGIGIELLTGLNSRYEGEYYNNEAHGFGIYYKGEANFYEGEWQQGKMHGNGIRHKGTTKELKGRFENNKKVAVSTAFQQETPWRKVK